MSDILLNMIHNRALETKPDVEISVANYHVWVDHWFKTAALIAVEFEKEGLINTAKTVRYIIEEQIQLLGNKYENEGQSGSTSAR